LEGAMIITIATITKDGK